MVTTTANANAAVTIFPQRLGGGGGGDLRFAFLRLRLRFCVMDDYGSQPAVHQAGDNIDGLVVTVTPLYTRLDATRPFCRVYQSLFLGSAAVR